MELLIIYILLVIAAIWGFIDFLNNIGKLMEKGSTDSTRREASSPQDKESPVLDN